MSESNTKDAKGVSLTFGQLMFRIMVVLFLLSLIAGAFWFVNWLYTPGNLPIKKIELINRLENQESRELQLVSAQAINGGFFSLNVEQFRTELINKLPWVKLVSVRKIWPDKLLLSIEEYKPVVRWKSVQHRLSTDREQKNNDLHYQLLSSEGVVFKPELTIKQQRKFNAMALISGTDERAKEIMQNCYVMNEHLQQIKLSISECGMNARRTWQLILNNGMTLKLGKEMIMPRLDRFIRSFNGALKDYIDRVAYADLRYSNGFSIKWKPEPKVID